MNRFNSVDVARQLQIAGNFIANCRVHIDWFKKGPKGPTGWIVLFLQIRTRGSSSSYSRIAAAEVSEIRSIPMRFFISRLEGPLQGTCPRWHVSELIDALRLRRTVSVCSAVTIASETLPLLDERSLASCSKSSSCPRIKARYSLEKSSRFAKVSRPAAASAIFLFSSTSFRRHSMSSRRITRKLSRLESRASISAGPNLAERRYSSASRTESSLFPYLFHSRLKPLATSSTPAAIMLSTFGSLVLASKARRSKYPEGRG